MYRLSTDVGGTFTDGVLLDEQTGRVRVTKVSSTPRNPAIGTIEVIEKFGVPLRDASFLSHGTTVVINALIQGKGARTALITTKGFRDILEIGRSNRTEMYDALYSIEITEEERIERNLSFHSWRHFFNSFFRTKIPDVKLMKLTGHKSTKMADHYTHFRLEDFQDVLEIQEGMF